MPSCSRAQWAGSLLAPYHVGDLSVSSYFPSVDRSICRKILSAVSASLLFAAAVTSDQLRRPQMEGSFELHYCSPSYASLKQMLLASRCLSLTVRSVEKPPVRGGCGGVASVSSDDFRRVPASLVPLPTVERHQVAKALASEKQIRFAPFGDGRLTEVSGGWCHGPHPK